MALGGVILECMNGKPRDMSVETSKYIASARERRAKGDIFGVGNPERWSDCKQLIDFVDELLDNEKAAFMKLEKPVSMQSRTVRELPLTD